MKSFPEECLNFNTRHSESCAKTLWKDMQQIMQVGNKALNSNTHSVGRASCLNSNLRASKIFIDHMTKNASHTSHPNFDWESSSHEFHARLGLFVSNVAVKHKKKLFRHDTYENIDSLRLILGGTFGHGTNDRKLRVSETNRPMTNSATNCITQSPDRNEIFRVRSSNQRIDFEHVEDINRLFIRFRFSQLIMPGGGIKSNTDCDHTLRESLLLDSQNNDNEDMENSTNACECVNEETEFTIDNKTCVKNEVNIGDGHIKTICFNDGRVHVFHNLSEINEIIQKELGMQCFYAL